MTLRLRAHGASPTVDALLAYANAVWEAGQELKADASNIIAAFADKHGTVRPITREFADEFLRGDRGHGIDTDEYALDLHAAIVDELNLLEMREDVLADEHEDRPGAWPYTRKEFPPAADLSEWYGDAGWLAICDGEAA
jgi:hypothetical protein